MLCGLGYEGSWGGAVCAASAEVVGSIGMIRISRDWTPLAHFSRKAFCLFWQHYLFVIEKQVAFVTSPKATAAFFMVSWRREKKLLQQSQKRVAVGVISVFQRPLVLVFSSGQQRTQVLKILNFCHRVGAEGVVEVNRPSFFYFFTSPTRSLIRSSDTSAGSQMRCHGEF